MDLVRTWSGLLASISLGGCTLSTTTIVPLPPVDARSVERGWSGASAVVATFRSHERSVFGHVEPARSCRIVELRTERHERVLTRKPYRAAGTLASAGAAMSGVAGGMLLSQLDTFSSRSRCDADGCSSPRRDAAEFGLLLVGASVALAATGIATFASRETRFAEEVASTPRRTRTLEPSVPCGHGAVSGLGVSLWRFDERVAATTTDPEGDAVLSVPQGISGTLRVVADSVPAAHPLVIPGETLAWVHVEPEPG